MDNPDAARKDIREALDAWLPVDVAFQVQHWYALWGQVETELYAGDVEEAEAFLKESQPRFEKSLLSPAAFAEHTHLEAIDGGFKTTHGLKYTITSDQLVAKGPTHRIAQFGDTPYEVSLAALLSESGAVMIHAERFSSFCPVLRNNRRFQRRDRCHPVVTD